MMNNLFVVTKHPSGLAPALCFAKADKFKVMNSQMRRIDLVCKLGGPLLIALLSGYSNSAAIISNLAMNCLSIVYEYYGIARARSTTMAVSNKANFVT
jgi:hypothetical protein